MLGRPENIPAILYLVDSFIKHKGLFSPISIMDVGPGWGKYGLMIKELIASMQAEAGDLTPGLSNITINAIEMCQYFKNTGNISDNFYFEDARAFNFKADLILLLDVLEHWNKSIALEFIKKHLNSGSALLVSVPKHTVMYTKPYYGKDCLKHETQFKMEDFESLGASVVKGNQFATLPSYNFLIQK